MNSARVRERVVRRVRPALSGGNESLVDYVKRKCSTRQKALAFMKRIGIRRTPSGGMYVVPV